MPPLIPLPVIQKAPEAVDGTDTVIVEVPAPLMDDRLNETDAPAGWTAAVSETTPAKAPIALTSTVNVPLAPGPISRLGGVTVTLKSGAGLGNNP